MYWGTPRLGCKWDAYVEADPYSSRMSRLGRGEGDSREGRDPTPVDPLLRAAAGEILRDEDAVLHPSQPPIEQEVLGEFRDFVLNDFLPWTADEESRLSASAKLSEDARGAVERAAEASYAEQFRETVIALVRELVGIGCLSHQEAATVRRASTAREIIGVGAIMVVGLEKLEHPPRAAKE
jgi:hypothetical protein